MARCIGRRPHRCRCAASLGSADRRYPPAPKRARARSPAPAQWAKDKGGSDVAAVPHDEVLYRELLKVGGCEGGDDEMVWVG